MGAGFKNQVAQAVFHPQKDFVGAVRSADWVNSILLESSVLKSAATNHFLSSMLWPAHYRETNDEAQRSCTVKLHTKLICKTKKIAAVEAVRTLWAHWTGTKSTLGGNTACKKKKNYLLRWLAAQFPNNTRRNVKRKAVLLCRQKCQQQLKQTQKAPQTLFWVEWGQWQRSWLSHRGLWG